MRNVDILVNIASYSLIEMSDIFWQKVTCSACKEDMYE